MAELKYKKCPDLNKIGDLSVFGVAECKSDIGFSKFKMVDPIWRTNIILNSAYKFLLSVIGSAILNFENLTSYLDSATPKIFTLKILRKSEVFVLKNIFGTTMGSLSPDSEGVKC